jgi:hypothetical protein
MEKMPPESRLARPLDQRYVKKLESVKDGKIFVPHITVRQSIFFLVLKLIVVELVAAAVLIGFHTLFFSPIVQEQLPAGISLFNVPLYLMLVAIKTFITYYIIFQWVDEYYEITTKEIIHRHGFVFKHDEHNSLNHVVSLRVYQGWFGRIFNFGTITLFNWAKNREFSLYLIHNPIKYLHILEALLPEPDEDRHMVAEKLFEEEDNDDSDSNE